MPNESRTRNNIIAGALALIAVMAIASYVYTRRAPAPSTDTTASSTPVVITVTEGGVTTSGGNVTVTEQLAAPAAPNYKTPLTFSSDTSADVRAALQKQFDLTVAALGKNDQSFDAWVNLATLRQVTKDYKGAETILAYVAKLYPKSTVPFDNLGSLYLDFIKDYPKAEVNFKLAIKNDPHNINSYEQLYSLYTTYGYKAGTSAAADLVAQGLKDNPSNQTLLDLQAKLNAN